MMREEFIRELRKIPGHENDGISSAEYAFIEQVYTWHPAIPNVDGKRVIAEIYAAGGMLVIADMLPRAEKAMDAEDEVRGLRKIIADAQQRIAEIEEEIVV